MRRNSHHSRAKTAIFTVIAVLLPLVFLETFSMAALGLMIGFGKLPPFHPLFTTATTEESGYMGGAFIFEPTHVYRHRPNGAFPVMAWKDGRFVRTILETDADGFIPNRPGGSTSLDAKAPGEFRIFVLGGSSVAGSGATSVANTLPAALEREFHERGLRHVRVINAGVGGYYSFLEMGYVASDLLAYRPDLVIFYDGYNDFYYPTSGGGWSDSYRAEHHKLAFHEYALFLVKSGGGSAFGGAINWLSTRFYTFDLASRALRKLAPDVAAGFDPGAVRNASGIVRIAPEEAARRYVGTVRSAMGVLAAHGVPGAYFLQGTVFDKPQLSAEEGDVVREAEGKLYAGANVARFWSVAREGFASLKAAPPVGGVCVDDMSRIWDGAAFHAFHDSVHSTDAGYAFIARAMADRLTAPDGCGLALKQPR